MGAGLRALPFVLGKRAIRTDDDDGLRLLFLDRLQDLDSIAAGQMKVENHDVRAFSPEATKGLRDVRGISHEFNTRDGGNHLLEPFDNFGGIVD